MKLFFDEKYDERWRKLELFFLIICSFSFFSGLLTGFLAYYGLPIVLRAFG